MILQPEDDSAFFSVIKNGLHSIGSPLNNIRFSCSLRSIAGKNPDMGGPQVSGIIDPFFYCCDKIW